MIFGQGFTVDASAESSPFVVDPMMAQCLPELYEPCTHHCQIYQLISAPSGKAAFGTHDGMGLIILMAMTSKSDDGTSAIDE